MCFSAGASFSAGVVLSTIGIATLKEVHKPTHKLFATMPLFFAFQQFAEGVVWITLRPGGNEIFQSAATYIFLFMALVAWPMMIPLSTYRMEENPKRKRMIGITIGGGLGLSMYYSVCLVNLNVYPLINNFHIQYINDFPKILGHVAFGIYAVVTVAPLFISSVKRMSVFGILIIISCLITGIFYREYLTSVWCFFAALISIIVYMIIRESQEELHLSKLKLMKLFSDQHK
jgi:hypothetical protein